MTCTNNLHPYATSKRAGEDFVLQAKVRSNIKTIVLRLSNAIGRPLVKEADCWNLVVNDLCKQVIMTNKMKITGQPNDQRNFIAISDVINFIEFLINNNLENWDTNIYNLGGENTFTIIEIAKLIRKRAKFLYGIEADIEIITTEIEKPQKNLNMKLTK